MNRILTCLKKYTVYINYFKRRENTVKLEFEEFMILILIRNIRKQNFTRIR